MAGRSLNFSAYTGDGTPEEWRAQTELPIVPRYWRYAACDGKPIPESGFSCQDLFARTPERVYLTEPAITIDIASDLLESGF